MTTATGSEDAFQVLEVGGSAREFAARDTDVSLRASERPEFDAWRWHEYWVPLDAVIDFKSEVYRRALTELERFMQARPQTRRERLYGFPHPVMPPSYADPTAQEGR